MSRTHREERFAAGPYESLDEQQCPLFHPALKKMRMRIVRYGLVVETARFWESAAALLKGSQTARMPHRRGNAPVYSHTGNKDADYLSVSSQPIRSARCFASGRPAKAIRFPGTTSAGGVM